MEAITSETLVAIAQRLGDGVDYDLRGSFSTGEITYSNHDDRVFATLSLYLDTKTTRALLSDLTSLKISDLESGVHLPNDIVKWEELILHLYDHGIKISIRPAPIPDIASCALEYRDGTVKKGHIAIKGNVLEFYEKTTEKPTHKRLYSLDLDTGEEEQRSRA